MDNLPNVFEIDVNKVPSEVLQQLIEEVRQDMEYQPQAYGRVHCRHNRGRGMSSDHHEEWARTKEEEFKPR